jgi:hypothetical protein
MEWLKILNSTNFLTLPLYYIRQFRNVKEALPQLFKEMLLRNRNLTPRFRRKREVWLRFFAENAQNDPKTHSYEDTAKFSVAFSATTLSHASRFRRKRGVIENFEYLCEF